MQKKILLACALAFSALASQAQVQKGDWLFGGSFGYGNSSNNNGSATTTGSNSNISPELGWGIGKNSVLGIRGSAGISASKDDGGNKLTYTSYMVGAFWRKFIPINETAGWFTDLSAGYSYSRNKYKYVVPTNSADSRNKGFSAAFSPGLYYMPSKKVQLTARAGGLTYNYSKYSYDAGGGSRNSNFSVTLFTYFGFGIDFIIGKS
jgi:hypothetical protein